MHWVYIMGIKLLCYCDLANVEGLEWCLALNSERGLNISVICHIQLYELSSSSI